MANFTAWSQIEAECGNYRDGFVATFRKYEGDDTDEKDARGRTVKVTMASFARHVGIPDRTFMDWVSKTAAAAVQPPQRTAADRVHQGARNLPAEGKLDLARQLMDDPEVGDQVVEIVEDEGIERRARRHAARPPERDPAEAVENVRRNMGRALGNDTDQATDYLRGAANDLAHAVVAKETWGIDYPADEAEAVAKVEHWLAVYQAKVTLTDDDRGWAESIGVEL